ncbi:putative serine/arginine repetitive matrix protein 2-like [Apostichopus japonicus]|uniref:Putative serine/arginine repetitive matrix protein 2-like n=1 Tax=Stichopus japonicus TaxID=307972 RepID=A0A2G8LC50_STIJA|nr:putative serine/arginine repetitive matrix protein 2-like [Apostichopus japonicus]
MTDTEAESDTPRSKEELSSRLTEERKTRRQATNVNHQLQIEYDELLAKYAEAENTIDHLRLGAWSHSVDLPPNGQMSRGQLTPAKQPMAFDIGVPQRGRYSMGESSRKQSDSSPQNATFGGNDRQPIQEHHTQTVIQEMKYSVANLAQQVPLLERAIDTKQVPVEEQEALFDHLKKAHSELEEDYMQRREEAREQQRWNSVLLDSEENQFDPERSLEGQIFQVGIQLEDLQEKVEENVRNNPPTMATRSRHSSIRQKSVDEDIPKKAWGGPQDDPEYSQMLQQYEALKQLPGTPKRDKEIQRLVKEIDNLQMTSKDDGEHGYISERSDWSDTPSKRRQSLEKRKEKGYSSGRDTPSSAHSLEERKATITEEKQTRNPRKIVKPLPAFPRKASDTAIDSGSSHPRSPEHEVDSGFVGSEGSRQSQKSKQNNIPRSKTTGGSHRLRPESGNTRIEESRLKRAQHHHTPIQELSERGQHSSSQSEGKRRSLPSRKLEPVAVATSEEEEVEGK